MVTIQPVYTYEYVYVGAGLGDYVYDPGSTGTTVPAENVMGSVAGNTVLSDSPFIMGYAQGTAGTNTVYVYLTQKSAGEIASQKLVVMGVKR